MQNNHELILVFIKLCTCFKKRIVQEGSELHPLEEPQTLPSVRQQ